VKNGKIRNIKKEVLSDNWYILNKYTYDYQKEDGSWETQEREAYDRGNGAAILLYNREKGTIILTRQFRMTTYVNGNSSGMLIEACAGLLDNDTPENAIRREAEEETGYRVDNVHKAFECYMSPGSVTEIVHFFLGAYHDQMKVGEGGGADNETENIEVLEYRFEDALQMISEGKIKDGKTIMLLQYAALTGIFKEC
jgi:nudix-type nucleoside diphosphatase (YffH/AdpP family)